MLETRTRMALMFPKPAKGSFREELLAKRAGIRTAEDKAKQTVRKRDGGQCRWPGCKERGERWRLEVAHLNDKGMGGDHGNRSTPDQLMLLCLPHHQGARSVHSGDLRIEPLTLRGTDGPCRFMEQSEAGWIVAGMERGR
jgi:hypothetical protein